VTNAPCPVRRCASFACDHCGAATPIRDARRGRLAPEGWPAVDLDLCPACYDDALESGILDQPA
jgi:hypothetical protein